MQIHERRDPLIQCGPPNVTSAFVIPESPVQQSYRTFEYDEAEPLWADFEHK